MEYLVADFKITCPTGLLQTARDLLADVAGEAGFESFEDTAEGIKGYVQTTLLDRAVLDDGLAAFPLSDTKVTYSLEPVKSEDWNATWEDAGFEPINIDDRIIIEDAKRRVNDQSSTPSAPAVADHKSQSSNLKPQRIVVDAQLAFGTGTHETTRMIVSTLLTMDLTGKRVLDCGCGTGILGIVASKLGARDVTAYDIDEWSVRNTRHNAQLNGVSNITVLLGDGKVLDGDGKADGDGKVLEKGGAEQGSVGSALASGGAAQTRVVGLYDVVIANINRNILLHDMAAMRGRMAPGASLILSGFYEGDIPLLKEKGASLGLTIKGIKKDSAWRCLILR